MVIDFCIFQTTRRRTASPPLQLVDGGEDDPAIAVARTPMHNNKPVRNPLKLLSICFDHIERGIFSARNQSITAGMFSVEKYKEHWEKLDLPVSLKQRLAKNIYNVIRIAGATFENFETLYFSHIHSHYARHQTIITPENHYEMVFLLWMKFRGMIT